MTETNQDQALPAAEPTVSTVPRWRAVRRLWHAQTVYIIALAAFAVLAAFAHFYAYFDWDLTAARTLQSSRLPGLYSLMMAVSFFGNSLTPWILTTVTAILFLVSGRRSEMAGLILSAGGGPLVNRLLKLVIGRPRPVSDLVRVSVYPAAESFPSGHVTFYVCYFGFLFFVAYALLPRGSMARRLALAATALPIALVGLSRVYLGAHWPSDTLGAYLLSGLWLAFSLDMYRRWKERATFHPEIQAQDEQIESRQN
jgi:membrane-associated phospholipid phosphatase